MEGYRRASGGKEIQLNVVKDSVHVLGDVSGRVSSIRGIPSGVEGLDDLFFTVKWGDGNKPVKVPLGGIPECAVVNVTGVPDTGKSIMVEQFAIKQASLGKKVCFVTVESPVHFLAVGMKERANAMGIDFRLVESNVVVVDVASSSRLREDVSVLLDVLAHVYREHDVSITVIDSVTGLFESREMLARSVVRALFSFMKKWYQTAMFVSQKRSSHEELTGEAAGGYAVGHIVDCTMVLSKEVVLSRAKARSYGGRIGDIVRLFRIDGCRLCGHDTKIHLMEIDEFGLCKIGPALTNVIEEQS